MRRALLWALLAAFAAIAAGAGSLFVLELKGGARVFALDRPLQKGRVVVFHRHPDGIYTSISAEEVVRIGPAGWADRSERIQPGELMVLGGDIEGRPQQGVGPPPEPPQTRSTYDLPDTGYGYGMYWGYGGGTRPPTPPPPPRPPAPTTIGPNGFPIIAPPGSPGSVPPRIGPNGFPIIGPRQPDQR